MDCNVEEYSKKFYSGNNCILEKENVWLKNIIAQCLITLSKDTAILDFGCGSGDWLSHYLGFSNTVYATDINPSAIEFCKKLGISNTINLFVYDGHQLQLKVESIGFITVFWVFQEILSEDEFIQVLSELNRVLKPGGKILIVDNQYSDVRTLVQTTPFGDLLKGADGDIIRQFKNNSLVPILEKFTYSLCKSESYGLSFFELYQKM